MPRPRQPRKVRSGLARRGGRREGRKREKGLRNCREGEDEEAEAHTKYYGDVCLVEGPGWELEEVERGKERERKRTETDRGGDRVRYTNGWNVLGLSGAQLERLVP